MYKIFALHPNHINSYGIGHAALALAKAMNSEFLSSRILCVSHNADIEEPILAQRFSAFFQRIVYRLCSKETIAKKTEQRYLDLLKGDEIAYLWPGCSLALYEEIAERGNLIATELINCHDQVARVILQAEAHNSGLVPSELIGDHDIELQNRKLALSAFIFSPSAPVTRSLVESGIDANKILTGSYGLHEYQQMDIDRRIFDSSRPLKAIFVGRVGVRKGIHLLIEYWKRSKINGELIIAGQIEEGVKDLVNENQNKHGIRFVDFIDDVSLQMLAVDVFLFPSLEEGSPYVCYEAIGAGLPCIVSPMGGEGVIEHGKSGEIIDPHATEEWVHAIQRMASNMELRRSYSSHARDRSGHFLWSKVGQRRANMLLEKLQIYGGK